MSTAGGRRSRQRPIWTGPWPSSPRRALPPRTPRASRAAESAAGPRSGFSRRQPALTPPRQALDSIGAGGRALLSEPQKMTGAPPSYPHPRTHALPHPAREPPAPPPPFTPYPPPLSWKRKTALAAGLTLIAAGVYGSREGAKFGFRCVLFSGTPRTLAPFHTTRCPAPTHQHPAHPRPYPPPTPGSYLERTLGKPSLVRETSRVAPWRRFLPGGNGSSAAAAVGPDPLKDVILESALAQRRAPPPDTHGHSSPRAARRGGAAG